MCIFLSTGGTKTTRVLQHFRLIEANKERISFGGGRRGRVSVCFDWKLAPSCCRKSVQLLGSLLRNRKVLEDKSLAEENKKRSGDVAGVGPNTLLLLYFLASIFFFL